MHLRVVLLMQADAGKPMKHFSPQYPPDADGSLATVSSISRNKRICTHSPALCYTGQRSGHTLLVVAACNG
jgi:hypothetical protein